MDVGAISWAAVVVAAVSTFLLGGLWYGPLFGRTWMAGSGVSAEQLAGGTGRVFAFSFLLQLVSAAVLALFVGPDPAAGYALAAAGAVGLFWVATALGVVYLFERRSLRHWAVNAGYQVAAYLLMGLVLGLWP